MTDHSLIDLVNEYVANCRIERLRAYVERGRPLADRTIEALNTAWVETYRAVRALEDESREHELADLRSEFDLRGIEPPMHLVAAEAARFVEQFQKRLRERKYDPVEAEKAEEEYDRLIERLAAPKH